MILRSEIENNVEIPHFADHSIPNHESFIYGLELFNIIRAIEANRERYDVEVCILGLGHPLCERKIRDGATL